MFALKYLLVTNLKNRIKDLKHNKNKLFFYIIMIALFGFILFTGGKDKNVGGQNIDILYAVCFALNGMMFYLMAKSGFTVGTTFFNMADVNYAFMSPLRPQSILYYGIIKQMASSLLAGLFILFQYATLHSAFGFNIGDIFILLVGYCFAIFSGQITALLIYSSVSNNEKTQKIVKYLFNGVFIALIAYVGIKALAKGDVVNSLVEIANQDFMNYIPVAGWTNIFFRGVYGEEVLIQNIILGLGLNVAYVGLIIFIIARRNLDFYEDVLQSTEKTTSAINSAKEHRQPEMVKNVKVGKKGIKKGFGANTFFYKHMLEERRISFIFVNKLTIILSIGIMIATYFFKGDSEFFYGVFGFSLYILLLTIGTGRWARELNKPFIYMLPEPAFKRLIYVSAENILKIFLDGIILFVPVSLMMGQSPIVTVTAIISYFGFGMILMSVNFLVDRILGSVSGKMVMMLFYFIMVIIISAPGMVLGIFISTSVITSGGPAVGFAATMIPSFVVNIIASLIITFLCRNILNYSELNNK